MDYSSNKSDNVVDAAKMSDLVSSVLEPYSFPKFDPSVEQALSPYKVWRFPVDGYDVVTYYTKTIAENSRICSLQVWSEDFNFLPFSIAVKVAKVFIKHNNLCLFHINNSGKFLYCWTKMTTLDGEPMKPIEKFMIEKQYGNLTYYFVKNEFLY